MSCSKCEPEAKSKRWLWWLTAVVLVSAVGWFEGARPEHSERVREAADARHK
jgi:hypothetical protein